MPAQNRDHILKFWSTVIFCLLLGAGASSNFFQFCQVDAHRPCGFGMSSSKIWSILGVRVLVIPKICLIVPHHDDEIKAEI